jgi:hypothetical protein
LGAWGINQSCRLKDVTVRALKQCPPSPPSPPPFNTNYIAVYNVRTVHLYVGSELTFSMQTRVGSLHHIEVAHNEMDTEYYLEG